MSGNKSEEPEDKRKVFLKVALLALLVYLYFEFICLVDVFSWLVN